MIDTLALANELEAAGMPRGQAGALADHLNRSLQAGLGQRLDRLGAGLAGVEQRLDRVKAQLVGMDQRLDRLEVRLVGVERRQADVEQRLVRIEAELAFHRWAFAIVIGLQIALLLRAFWPV